MLSTGAFNALLKTLEEPPAHAVFLLATTEPHRIPPTILSRCQRYDFRRISNESIVDRLANISKKQGINIERDALSAIATIGDGALRDSISLLDQVSTTSDGKTITRDDILRITGVVDESFLNRFATALLEGRSSDLLTLCRDLTMDGRDLIRFTLDLAQYFRNILVTQISPAPSSLIESTSSAIEAMTALGRRFDTTTSLFFISRLSDLTNELKWSPSMRTSFEIMMLRLASRGNKIVPGVVAPAAPAAAPAAAPSEPAPAPAPAPEKEAAPAPAPIEKPKEEPKKEETPAPAPAETAVSEKPAQAEPAKEKEQTDSSIPAIAKAVHAGDLPAVDSKPAPGKEPRPTPAIAKAAPAPSPKVEKEPSEEAAKVPLMTEEKKDEKLSAPTLPEVLTPPPVVDMMTPPPIAEMTPPPIAEMAPPPVVEMTPPPIAEMAPPPPMEENLTPPPMPEMDFMPPPPMDSDDPMAGVPAPVSAPEIPDVPEIPKEEPAPTAEELARTAPSSPNLHKAFASKHVTEGQATNLAKATQKPDVRAPQIPRDIVVPEGESSPAPAPAPVSNVQQVINHQGGGDFDTARKEFLDYLKAEHTYEYMFMGDCKITWQDQTVWCIMPDGYANSTDDIKENAIIMTNLLRICQKHEPSLIHAKIIAQKDFAKIGEAPKPTAELDSQQPPQWVRNMKEVAEKSGVPIIEVNNM